MSTSPNQADLKSTYFLEIYGGGKYCELNWQLTYLVWTEVGSYYMGARCVGHGGGGSAPQILWG